MRKLVILGNKSLSHTTVGRPLVSEVRKDVHMMLYLEPKAAVAIKHPPPSLAVVVGVGVGSGVGDSEPVVNSFE